MTEQQAALARREDGGLDLSAYDPAKCNILTPTLRYDSAAPFLRYRVVEVRLEPDHEKGECYPAPGSRWTKIGDRRVPLRLAPAKPGLLKIAAASGLVIAPIQTRIRPDTCDRCIALAAAHRQATRCGDCAARFDTAYRYVGAIRSDTGWRIMSATYEWNLDAQKRKVRREGRKRQEAYEAALAKVASGEWKRPPQPFDYEEYVRDRIDQVTTERYGLAETKALLRLVRAICFVRQVYDREEMAQPFIIVRTDLAPDFSDPEVRRALAQQATQSGAQLFAGTAEDRPIDVAFEEHLRQAPDFEKAPEGVEEIDVPIDGNGEDGAPDDFAEGPEEAGDMSAPAAKGPAGGGEQQPKAAGPPEPAACVVCQKPLAAGRRAWCESEAGQRAVGGRLICFGCQEAEAQSQAAEGAE